MTRFFKMTTTLFFLLLFLTACEGDYRFAPSGLPYVESQHLYEDYDNNEPAEPTAQTDSIYAEPLVTPPADRPAQTSGVLTLHMRPPLTLNPLLNQDITVARILRLIYEPLAVLDDQLRITGHLADLQFASDFGSVNATIREDAIWSCGMPVTADDIIFSVETLRRAPANAIYRANVENIASVTRINTRTVQIAFTQASVMAKYSLNFPIIPQHVEIGEIPVGNGLFTLETHTPARSLTLRRSPYTFRRRAQIEEIEVIFLPDTATDFYAFERGRIDALHLPLTEWMRHPGVRSPRYEVFPAMYFEFIGFNFSNPIFRELSTRQGIAHAFNASEAVASLYLAHAVHSATPIHPMGFAANAEISGAVYDPARAAALPGALRFDQPLEIITNEENPQRVSIAQRLAQSLTVAGLDAVAVPLPFDEFNERLSARDFDLYIGGVQLPFAPDVRLFFQSGGLFVHDAALDAAFSALLIASTEIAYAAAISNLQQVFVERLPVIGLAFRHSALLVNPRIESELAPTPDGVFTNINNWAI